MLNDANDQSKPFQVLDGAQPMPAAARVSVLAIGNFDGVHRGHQALLEVARGEAARRSSPAGVVVFEPHPRTFFRPDLPYFRLTPRAQQLRLFARLGLDLAVVLPFDAALSNLSARAFAEQILLGRLHAAHVVVGYDFHFGKGRMGTPAAMRELGRELGFGVTVVEPVGDGSATYSSSAIRELLAGGDVAAAGMALGHRWRIDGVVTGGAKRGTGLGFPTANIGLPAGTGLRHGIYAVRVHVAARCYAGAAYVGSRPQFDNGTAALEVFLLDFDGDLYGQEISVEFVEFVRGDATFDGLDALKRQMALDCVKAREILGRIAADDPLRGSPLA